MERSSKSRDIAAPLLRSVAVALTLVSGVLVACRTSHYGSILLVPQPDYLATSSGRPVDLENTDVIRLGRITGEIAKAFGLQPVEAGGPVAAFESPPHPDENSFPHLLVSVGGGSQPTALVVTVIDFDHGTESDKASRLRAAIEARARTDFPNYELRYESRSVDTSFAP